MIRYPSRPSATRPLLRMAAAIGAQLPCYVRLSASPSASVSASRRFRGQAVPESPYFVAGTHSPGAELFALSFRGPLANPMVPHPFSIREWRAQSDSMNSEGRVVLAGLVEKRGCGWMCSASQEVVGLLGSGCLVGMCTPDISRSLALTVGSSEDADLRYSGKRYTGAFRMMSVAYFVPPPGSGPRADSPFISSIVNSPPVKLCTSTNPPSTANAAPPTPIKRCSQRTSPNVGVFVAAMTRSSRVRGLQW